MFNSKEFQKSQDFDEYVRFYMSATILLKKNFQHLAEICKNRQTAYAYFDPVKSGLVELILSEAEAKFFDSRLAFAPIMAFDQRLANMRKSLKVELAGGEIALPLNKFFLTTPLVVDDEITDESSLSFHLRIRRSVILDEVVGEKSTDRAFQNSEDCMVRLKYNLELVHDAPMYVLKGYDNKKVDLTYSSEDISTSMIEDSLNLSDYIDEVVIRNPLSIAFNDPDSMKLRYEVLIRRLLSKYRTFTVNGDSLDYLLSKYVKFNASNGYVPFSVDLQKSIFFGMFFGRGGIISDLKNKTIVIE